jgi:hypothetical protein
MIIDPLGNWIFAELLKSYSHNRPSSDFPQQQQQQQHQ